MPILYIDGQSLRNNQKGVPRKAKIAVVYQRSQNPTPTPADSTIFWQDIGDKTNNQAEYFALLEALSIILSEQVTARRERDITIRSDSKLVVEQMKGNWRVEDPDLVTLHGRAKEMMEKIGPLDFQWVPRERNYAGLWLEGVWKGPPVDLRKTSW